MKNKAVVKTMAIGLSAAMAFAQPLAVLADEGPSNQGEDPSGQNTKEPEEAAKDVVVESKSADENEKVLQMM